MYLLSFPSNFVAFLFQRFFISHSTLLFPFCHFSNLFSLCFFFPPAFPFTSGPLLLSHHFNSFSFFLSLQYYRRHLSEVVTECTRGSHKTSFPALCPPPQSVINSKGALSLPLPYFLGLTTDKGPRSRPCPCASFPGAERRTSLGIQFSLRLCV